MRRAAEKTRGGKAARRQAGARRKAGWRLSRATQPTPVFALSCAPPEGSPTNTGKSREICNKSAQFAQTFTKNFQLWEMVEEIRQKNRPGTPALQQAALGRLFKSL